MLYEVIWAYRGDGWWKTHQKNTERALDEVRRRCRIEKRRIEGKKSCYAKGLQFQERKPS